MKTFSKILSMILVAVMCFSLFATSAYALSFDGSFSLDGGDSFAPGNDDGFGFSLDDGTAGFSYADDDGFSFSGSDDSFDLDYSAAQSEPAQEQQYQADDDTISLDISAQPEQIDLAEEQKTEAAGDGTFSLEDEITLGEPYKDGMTFTAAPTSVKITDTDAAATVKITCTGGVLDNDTFKRITYSTSPSGESRQALPSTAFSIVTNTLTIEGSWLKTLAVGMTYYFYGERTDALPIPLGFVGVYAGSAGDYGTFTVTPGTYVQYGKPESPLVTVTASNTLSLFSTFAFFPQGTTSNGAKCSDYTMSTDNRTIIFGKTFLLSLKAGVKDIYGITASNVPVKLGSVIIKSANGGSGTDPDGNAWTLWPDYSIPWTSGDDPLIFKSNLMAMRSKYPRYTIVPRWGVGAGSTPNNMVDVNEFWDMGDGVFALGTNFLRSLPAGTYTLQVVDYKKLSDCTNVVTFRIGSTLRAIDTDKHVIGSIKNLRFLCDEPVYEVYVGNIPLTYGEDYALSNGNQTVTLSFEFLNKRSPGNTYTIKVLTASGTYPSATFQILSTAQGSASPKTGDESNLGLWAAFLLLSGTAVVVLVPKLRKHDF